MAQRSRLVVRHIAQVCLLEVGLLLNLVHIFVQAVD